MVGGISPQRPVSRFYYFSIGKWTEEKHPDIDLGQWSAVSGHRGSPAIIQTARVKNSLGGGAPCRIVSIFANCREKTVFRRSCFVSFEKGKILSDPSEGGGGGGVLFTTEMFLDEHSRCFYFGKIILKTLFVIRFRKRRKDERQFVIASCIFRPLLGTVINRYLNNCFPNDLGDGAFRPPKGT